MSKNQRDALAVAIHRATCDNGDVTPAAQHEFHYHEADGIIGELRKWDVHVVHISDIDEFPRLTVDAAGGIAA